MRKGFTLIELLVVIAIIALLVSILIPSLQSAKDLAKVLQCQINLKAVGRGMWMYGQDYRNVWLAPWDNSGRGDLPWWRQWPYTIAVYSQMHRPRPGKLGTEPGARYLDDNEGEYRRFYPDSAPYQGSVNNPTMFCPVALSEDVWWGQSNITNPAYTWTNYSYAMIGKNTWGDYSLRGYPKPDRFTHADETVVFGDAGGVTSEFPRTNAWTNYDGFRISPHMDGSNWSMGDLSVRRIPEDSLTEYMFESED